MLKYKYKNKYYLNIIGSKISYTSIDNNRYFYLLMLLLVVNF